MDPVKTALPVSKIIIGVVALLLIGGGVVAMSHKGSDVDKSPVREEKKVSESLSRKSSLKDLLSRGGSSKCTFTSSNDLNSSSGTFYTADGKGRGDFETAIVSGPGAGTVMKSHMISEGDTMYTWDETTGVGVKMSLSQMTATSGETQANNAQIAEQMNADYDYECDSWSGDATVFTPPANIMFHDMSEMMNDMKMKMPIKAPTAGSISAPLPVTGGKTMMTVQCSACDQAGDQRDACRAALGC